MERHRCKLCYRNFANGRALGGHMRSHMVKLYAAQKSQQDEVDKHQPLDQDSDDDILSVHSYSTTSEDEDWESETGSFKVTRRSKRVRKSRISDFNSQDEYEVLSSISDTSPEEHVAHCLIMLSRDKWDIIEEKEKKNNNNNNIVGDDYSQDSSMVKVIKTSNNKVRGKYRCETCNKLFKSYQALGGHRASHKKIKSGSGSTAAAAVEAMEKAHECPFCDRVFSSGQALGGHKRSHFMGPSAISGNVEDVKENISRNGEFFDIDLNLPAPVDDNDDISQISDLFGI